MAKKQTRKSISASCHFFDRFKQFCERNNIPMSAFLEFALSGDLSRPLDRAAYDRWRVVQLQLTLAAKVIAAKRARHAAGLARVRASDKAAASNGNDNGNEGSA
jgi:hypothetical protein